MIRTKQKDLKIENFRIAPAGYNKIRITYFRNGNIKNPYTIIVDRNPEVEKFLTKKLNQHDCIELYRIIKKKSNERLDQRSFARRTQKGRGGK